MTPLLLCDHAPLGLFKAFSSALDLMVGVTLPCRTCHAKAGPTHLGPQLLLCLLSNVHLAAELLLVLPGRQQLRLRVFTGCLALCRPTLRLSKLPLHRRAVLCLLNLESLQILLLDSS